VGFAANAAEEKLAAIKNAFSLDMDLPMV